MVNKLNIGDLAPDFILKSQDGVDISLKDFRGKKVVLYFYPKDMTPGCTKEACSFRDNYENILRKNAVIIGISADSVERHKKFKEKYDLQFDLLSDDKKIVSKLYGVWKQKKFMGKKYMGIERTTFIINENGKILEIFRKVNVQNHSEEVIKHL